MAKKLETTRRSQMKRLAAMKKKSGIPKEKYLDREGCTFITIDMLYCYHTQALVDSFRHFMRGQTMMLLPSGNSGYCSWDYERWLNGLTNPFADHDGDGKSQTGEAMR